MTPPTSENAFLHGGFPRIRLYWTCHTQYYTFTFAQRNTQQGSVGEGGSCAGLRADLPLRCYLLLRHKGAPRQSTWGRKARQRMSQLELHREEDPRLSSMTTLSSMNTIYATGSLFSNRPPVPSSSPRALITFTGTLLVLCVLPHPFLSPFLPVPPFSFYRLNQERCSPSIANWLWCWTFITWQLGVCMVEMWERERAERAAGEECGLILRGHYYHHTLCQCHRGWLVHTHTHTLTVKLLED